MGFVSSTQSHATRSGVRKWKRRLAHRTPLPGEYYLHSDRVWKVLTVSRGTDSIVLKRIEDGKLYEIRYSIFSYGFKRVWKIGDVAKFLERSPRSIYRYEARGQIEKAKRYPTVGGKELRFYTKEDVLEIHSLISEIHQGKPRKDGRSTNNTTISRYDLLNMFRERFGT